MSTLKFHLPLTEELKMPQIFAIGNNKQLVTLSISTVGSRNYQLLPALLRLLKYGTILLLMGRSPKYQIYQYGFEHALSLLTFITM